MLWVCHPTGLCKWQSAGECHNRKRNSLVSGKVFRTLAASAAPRGRYSLCSTSFYCFWFTMFIFPQIKDTFSVVQECSQLSKANDFNADMQKLWLSEFKNKNFLCHSVVEVSLKARFLSPLGTNVHPDGLPGKPGSAYEGTDNHRHGGGGGRGTHVSSDTQCQCWCKPICDSSVRTYYKN